MDGSQSVSTTEAIVKAGRGKSLAQAFDASWLRSTTRPGSPTTGGPRLRVADLFSGCGGLSLGAFEACRALGMTAQYAFACDMYAPANEVYASNFSPSVQLSSPLEEHVDGDLGSRTTPAERSIVDRVGDVDLVVAGPPCQGHSDLNNHTRRADPKNRLVVRVARFAELFLPNHVLIENVQGIRHDRLGALGDARSHLEGLGYRVTEHLLSADAVGVAQNRRRYFLFASRMQPRPLEALGAAFGHSTVTVRWAIEDLAEHRGGSVFDTASTPTEPNRKRMAFLFKRSLYDLPNEQRPLCHQGGDHSYKAVYGRLHWDQPAPTITTGFGCMGQGRFVHPEHQRTLTPHEAARLQFFPDFFEFGVRKRGEYQQLIGNAVPPKLAYAVLLYQLA
jgi:DNA (cytosine-5)-methyltransferase 1